MNLAKSLLAVAALGLTTFAGQDAGGRRATRGTLAQIVKGRSNKEIADALAVSEDAVKWTLRGLFQKLGVLDRTQAAVDAIHRGIIHID